MTIRLHPDEKDSWEKYSGSFYRAETITVTPPAEPTEYADKILRVRMDLAAAHVRDAVVLDLGCGTGEHLLALAGQIRSGKGLDFSAPFIECANRQRDAAGALNIEFLQGNARCLPFADGSFDLAYSFSALYHMPEVEQVIREIARVLRPGGRCVLDLGNKYSLNTLCCHWYPEAATLFVVSVGAMKRMFRDAGLRITCHRSFQLLPLWADRPRWLKPLLWPGWTRLMRRQVRGKLLDEWISSLPGIRRLAFRHVFVCERE